MDLLLIIGTSGLVGLTVSFLSAADAHSRVQESYKQGKLDGFAEGITAGEEHGFQRGKHTGFVDGLRRGRTS